MMDIKQETNITKTITTQITISDKLYSLFIKWIRTTQLSKQKMHIMKTIKANKTMMIQDLVHITNMSPPLIAYHINGNLNSDGLIDAEMVKPTNVRGQVKLELTQFGNLILELTQ